MTFAVRPSRRSLFTAAGLGAGAALLAACGSGTADGGGALSVVTSAYPLAYLVTKIGGEHVELTDLTTPGADAHGIELSVKQVMAVQSADLVLQIPGLQTSLDDAISSQDGENVLDVSSIITLLPVGAAEEHSHESGEEHAEHEHGDDDHEDGHEDSNVHEDHDHGPHDPHFWHDPLLMADLADALAERLGELAPDGAEEFTSAAQELRTELETLDAELAESFGAVEGRKPFITSHAAYAYLAQRYDLHQIGISGVDPENEPSPQRLLALEEVVDEEGVTTVFFETSASPKVAQTLADNLGIDSAELDNLEAQLSEESDYAQVMRENCTALVESWT